MKTSELLDLLNTALRDIRKPRKWSDDVKVRYLNEAQDKLSRALFVTIRSDEPLSVGAYEDFYELDENIHHVFRVWGKDVGVLQPSTDGWTPPSEQLGTPARFVLDSATQTLRLWPIPTLDTELIMRVSRSPKALSENALDEDCEIPDQFQLALIDWAAYRCFTHDDADGRNDNAAQLAKDRYSAAVREYKQNLYRFRTGNANRVGGNRIR